MKEQLIMDSTTVYEVDLECLQKKEEQAAAGAGRPGKELPGASARPERVSESRKEPAL